MSTFGASASHGTRLAPFGGTATERVDDFIRSFNWYAKAAKWEEGLKCEGLNQFLTGKANLWYESIFNRSKPRKGDAPSGEEEKKAVNQAKEMLEKWDLLEAAMKKYFEPQEIR